MLCQSMHCFIGRTLLSDSERWQVSDFLMRVKSRRFPSIEKDMKMVLAHCGSLLLDPASLCQARCAYHLCAGYNLVAEPLHTHDVPNSA